MAEIIVPKIDEENYDAFHTLPGDGMPPAYAGWLRDRSAEIAHNKSLGHSSREVAIYPDEVRKFRAGRPPDVEPMKSIEDFLFNGPLDLQLAAQVDGASPRGAGLASPHEVRSALAHQELRKISTEHSRQKESYGSTRGPSPLAGPLVLIGNLLQVIGPFNATLGVAGLVVS